MAFQAHIAIKGTRQGQFKGEGIQKARKDKWCPVLSFSQGISAPKDVATGQASGKRQWKPVKIIKEWGAASPQALLAAVTNEVLPTVNIEFTKTDATGKEYVYQTIALTNATLASIRRFSGGATPSATLEGDTERADAGSSRHTMANSTMECEEWTFTFQKIEVTDNDGKTSFGDDWAATT